LAAARSVIDAEPLARLDYADVVDPESMQDVESANRPVLLALAAYFGRTRLIDNRILATRSEKRATSDEKRATRYQDENHAAR
jgi:pantothenate synthetase